MVIRISALDNEASPVATEFLAIDGSSTRKTTIQAAVDAGAPVASQAEAEAGSDNSKRMTALTVKQSIAAEVGDTLASAAQGALANTALQPGDVNDLVFQTLADMKASPPADGQVAFLNAAGREGTFKWTAGNFSSQVAADPSEITYVKADSVSASTGAWVREMNISFPGSVPRTPIARAQDYPHVFDFIPAAQHSAILNYTSTYDATADVLAGFAAIGSGELYAPSGVIGFENVPIFPGGCSFVGAGRYDWWGSNNFGTILKGLGAGVASRWTDIDGADAADDVPLIVAGGNNVWLKRLTLMPGDDGRTMGFFLPSVKQCGIEEVDAFGFTDACLYLDATWSDRNTTLKALHPTVVPSTGMNEFKADKFFMMGGGTAGFAIKGQGTTRAGNAVATAADWLWGWGGMSDTVITNGRLGGVGANGGCLSHDGQLFGAGVYLQGFTVRDTAFRLSSAGRYAAKFDRSNRIILDGCYGESVGSNAPVIAVTSRTQVATDGILRVNDKLNADIWLDGVATGTSGSSVPWETTRCIVTHRANQNRMFTPNIEAYGNSSAQPVRFTSFDSDGGFRFYRDDGTARVEEVFRAQRDVVRSGLASTTALGSQAFPWSRVVTHAIVTPGWSPLVIAAGVITVTGSTHRVDTEGSTATDDLTTINGGQDGQRVVFRSSSSARDVTFKDDTGNLKLAGDFTLATSSDTIELIYDNATALWYELRRSTN